MSSQQHPVVRQVVSRINRGASTSSGRSSSARGRRGSSSQGGSPAKRRKITADDTARVETAQQLSEHANTGASGLSVRDGPTPYELAQRRPVVALSETALRLAAHVLLRALSAARAQPSDKDAGDSMTESAKPSIGWDPQARDLLSRDLQAYREFVRHLPPHLIDRLLALVLALLKQDSEKRRASQPARDGEEYVPEDSEGATKAAPNRGKATKAVTTPTALATVFFSDRLMTIRMQAVDPSAGILKRVSQCSNLATLDLSGCADLKDKALAEVVSHLPNLQAFNARGCVDVGDATVVALSKASGANLRVANLSLTGVTVRALALLGARCPNLEVLKLANVNNLNERGVTTWLDDANSIAGASHTPFGRLKTLKLRQTAITDSALGRLLPLCAGTLRHLDISFCPELKSLDILTRALASVPVPDDDGDEEREYGLSKLVASGLALNAQTLVEYFRFASADGSDRRLSEQARRVARRTLRTLKLASIRGTRTTVGLDDAVLAKLLPYLAKFERLENVTLAGNMMLGRGTATLHSFFGLVGRRCKHLDLTSVPVRSVHLEGLGEGDAAAEVLVLDHTAVDDGALVAISQCANLRALHLAETKISAAGLASVMAACQHLHILNLKSCRGVPLTQRRRAFDAFESGDL